MRSIKQQLNTFNQRSEGFLRNAKSNGNVGFVLVCDLMKFWAESGDSRPLHNLIKNAVYSDAKQFRVIVAECVDDSVSYTDKGGFKRDKAKKAASASNTHGVSLTRVEDMAKLAEGGASFRGYQKAKAKDERSELEKNEAKLAKSLADTLRLIQKQEMTIEQYAALLRLLKVEQDEEGNVKAAA